ncbi:hypothetical protein AK812_SmicGene14155 [Symbiodinium microadriaticum]|uniref:Uncharacterized protein n=1 Tax=Symbiodinium microadriaticum TaxID=2951 RepID=A0A1Q9E673_SYMMI|nr:hypothetical protein AK812_SmicGene14155 [Symbiodinium microadriaticum]
MTSLTSFLSLVVVLRLVPVTGYKLVHSEASETQKPSICSPQLEPTPCETILQEETFGSRCAEECTTKVSLSGLDFKDPKLETAGQHTKCFLDMIDKAEQAGDTMAVETLTTLMLGEADNDATQVATLHELQMETMNSQILAAKEDAAQWAQEFKMDKKCRPENINIDYFVNRLKVKNGSAACGSSLLQTAHQDVADRLSITLNRHAQHVLALHTHENQLGHLFLQQIQAATSGDLEDTAVGNFYEKFVEATTGNLTSEQRARLKHLDQDLHWKKVRSTAPCDVSRTTGSASAMVRSLSWCAGCGIAMPPRDPAQIKAKEEAAVEAEEEAAMQEFAGSEGALVDSSARGQECRRYLGWWRLQNYKNKRREVPCLSADMITCIGVKPADPLKLKFSIGAAIEEDCGQGLDGTIATFRVNLKLLLCLGIPGISHKLQLFNADCMDLAGVKYSPFIGRLTVGDVYRVTGEEQECIDWLDDQCGAHKVQVEERRDPRLERPLSSLQADSKVPQRTFVTTRNKIGSD